MKLPRIATLFPLGMLLLCTVKVGAQAPAGPPDPQKEGKKEVRGITLYESFGGSYSTGSQVMDLTSTAGYIFNEHFSVDGGLPVSMIRGTTSTGTKISTNGIGDVFTHFKLTFNNPTVNYITTLTATAPTGDSAKGLSTGRPSFDWSNNFSRDFGRFSPFTTVGLGTTVYGTRYLRRSFLTLGKAAHFEVGTGFDLGHSFSVSASAYDVAGWGQQKVFSRIVTKSSGARGPKGRRDQIFQTSSEIVGGSDLVKDNGFNTALDMNPTPFLDLEVAFSRSTHYHENTVSFSIGFNLSSAFHKSTH